MSVLSQQCGSESRAFFVIDSLTPGRLLWIKKALVRLGSTLAVTLKQPCPVGIAVLQRPKPGQAAQLQIILRLTPLFQVKEYVTCVKRLVPADDNAVAADGAVLGSALYALVQHMQKLPARQDCKNHLFIISSSFASCTNSPKMQRLLQVLSLQPSYSLHFLQVTEPVSGLQTQEDHDTCDDQQLQQGAAPKPGVNKPMCDLRFSTLLSSLPQCDGITYDEFITDCEAVAELICQSWLRELLAPCSNSSSNSYPDAVVHIGKQVLSCSLQQHILQLEPWLLPAHLCPCHHLPMQPGTVSSGAAAAYAAAAAAASDGGSTAALLTLPEVCPWLCCISGQPVRVPLSSCPCDARILQLGRHTQLAVPPPPTAAAAPMMPDASAVPAHAGTHTNSKMHVMQALPLSVRQPCVIQVRHLVAPSAVDGMLLYGMPLLLTPTDCGDADTATPAAAQAMDAGLQQSHACRQQKPTAEADMLMRALCQLLLEQQQVLLAVSNHDLIRRIQLPLQQWYLLQPAADGSSLLLRNMASAEQLLPPRARGHNGLGRSIGSSSREGTDEQVVLLDAQQLESVKASLAGLECLSDGCAGSHVVDVQGSGSTPDAILSHQQRDTAGDGDQEGSAAHAGAGCQRMPRHPSPLLLSCGLDTWVAAVLEASAATYLPPSPKPLSLAAGPVLPPASGSVPQAHVTTGAPAQLQGTTDHTLHLMPPEMQQAAQPAPATCQTTSQTLLQQQQQVAGGTSTAEHQQQKQNGGKETAVATAAAACNAQEVPVVNCASSAVTRGQIGLAGSKASRGKRSSNVAAASNRKLRLSRV